jgi:hypothetical protein
MIDDFFTYDEVKCELKYVFNESEYSIIIENLVNAMFIPDHKLILITTEKEKNENIYGYSVFGKNLFKQPAPDHYKLWYIIRGLRIAFMGKDEFAEKSGLSGWWFKLNPINGELTKDCWAY